jgi:hypothetical protein
MYLPVLYRYCRISFLQDKHISSVYCTILYADIHDSNIVSLILKRERGISNSCMIDIRVVKLTKEIIAVLQVTQPNHFATI